MSRRRTGPAGLASAVVVAALAACGAGGGTGDGTSTGTGAAQSPSAVRLTAPTAVRAPAPAVDVPAGTVPLTYADGPTVHAVAPGWAERPLERDGVFVGRGPVGEDGAVAIVAADRSGTVLWRARGPEGTRVELGRLRTGRTVVVLAAPAPGGTWTAGGYDLGNGATVWEQDLPGAVRGPGLVVDAPDGPRLLDAASGGTAAPSTGAEFVAEHDGVAVTSGGGELSGHRDGAELWTTPLTALGLAADASPAVVAGASPPRGTLLLGDGGSGPPSSGALLDVADGTVVATGVRDARLDRVLGSWVLLGEGTLSAQDGTTALWSRAVPDGATLAAVDRVLAYVRSGDQVLAVNTATGADAQAYDLASTGPLAVPAVAGSEGGVALSTGEWLLLTTAGP